MPFLHDRKKNCLCEKGLAHLLSVSGREEVDGIVCHESRIGGAGEMNENSSEGREKLMKLQSMHFGLKQRGNYRPKCTSKIKVRTFSR